MILVNYLNSCYNTSHPGFPPLILYIYTRIIWKAVLVSVFSDQSSFFLYLQTHVLFIQQLVQDSLFHQP